MLRTPNSIATSSFSSTSHLPTTILPSKSSANSEIIGATMRQGPHHGAQRSTTKGKEPFLYSWKFAVVIVTSIIFFVFIVLL